MRRCLIGYATIKKDQSIWKRSRQRRRSRTKYRENEKVDRPRGTNGKQYRYVPEFLRHFRGSLIKATRSNTFETAPIIQIMITAWRIYV